MAKFYAKGDRLNYTNGDTAAIDAGSVVVVESVVGVAEAPIAKSATGALSIVGVFTFESSAACTQGKAVFMNSSTKKVTGTSASGLINIGIAMNSVTAAGKTVYVKLINPTTTVTA